MKFLLQYHGHSVPQPRAPKEGTMRQHDRTQDVGNHMAQPPPALTIVTTKPAAQDKAIA